MHRRDGTLAAEGMCESGHDGGLARRVRTDDRNNQAGLPGVSRHGCPLAHGAQGAVLAWVVAWPGRSVGEALLPRPLDAGVAGAGLAAGGFPPRNPPRPRAGCQGSSACRGRDSWATARWYRGAASQATSRGCSTGSGVAGDTVVATPGTASSGAGGDPATGGPRTAFRAPVREPARQTGPIEQRCSGNPALARERAVDGLRLPCGGASGASAVACGRFPDADTASRSSSSLRRRSP